MQYSSWKFALRLVAPVLAAGVMAGCNLFPSERPRRVSVGASSVTAVQQRASALFRPNPLPMPCGVIHGAVGNLDSARQLGTVRIQLSTGGRVTSTVSNSLGHFDLAVPDSTVPTLRITSESGVMLELRLAHPFRMEQGYRMAVVLYGETSGTVYTMWDGCMSQVH